MGFKVTAAIYSQGRSWHFQERNWISTRQFGWISQSFWSSQQSIADSITRTQNWDWIYKSKRRFVQSLLQGYSWTFKQTSSVIVSVWKKTWHVSFPSKSLNNTVINSFLQKLSTWVTAKSNISTRIDFLLLTSVTFLRAITMCSAFAFGFGYNKSTNILIGDVYCPNKKCLGRLCLHKKTFESLGRSDYQCPQCASVCQVRNIPFEEQTNSFFLSLGQGVYIFEESPKSIQDFIGDVYWPGEYCLNREKCKSTGGYVTTPRSIFGCDNCGAWLFVHKVPFTLQEHVKTTETDKTRYFFARKRWLCYPTNICSLISFLETIPHQSQSPAPKKDKSSPNME